MESAWYHNKYKRISKFNSFKVYKNGHTLNVLLNPEIGSWVILSDEELAQYKDNQINCMEGEFLYLRKLSKGIDGEQAKISFLDYADYPSIAVINITEQCNMFCKYCFANSDISKKMHMSEDVMQNIVNQMRDMPEIKHVVFEIQGGEPFLVPDIIEKFVILTKSSFKNSNKKFSFKTTTNATLIDDNIIKLIKKYNIEVSISLDGPKEIHDSYRIYKNGKGSFDDTWRGTQKLREAGELSGVVCNITNKNVKKPRELVDFFGKYDISFKPRPVCVLGREVNNKTAPSGKDWFECFKVLHFYSQEKGVENLASTIFSENAYTPVRDYICLRSPCGAGREIINFNPNGDVHPCDGFKDYEEFCIGNVMNENVVDMLKKPIVQSIKNRSWENIPKCKKCIFKAMCGSCAYSAYGAFNDCFREDTQCESRFNIFKFLISNWVENNC